MSTQAIDPLSSEFLSQVEDAWYARTKGDLCLVPADDDIDAELARVIGEVVRYAQETIEATAAAQYDASGNEIDTVDASEMARRVAAALDVLLYGG